MDKTSPGRTGKQPPERGILDAMEDLESKRRKKKGTDKPGEPQDEDDDLDLSRIW
jgi:hypothetical protein